MSATDKSDCDVTGYLDPQVLRALDRKRHEVSLRAERDRLEVTLLQLRARTVINILVSEAWAAAQPVPDIRNLFLDLVKIVAPTYAFCHLDAHSRMLHEQHYDLKPRTFYASGLYWLNFFGPDEEARQGGAALERIPNARIERRPEGLLIEVGGGPLDAATPEGERMLLEATAAMPPLPPMDADAVEHARKPGGEALTTLNGVRGFFDPADNGFWISKHIDGDAPLDRKAVAKWSRLVGEGKPPVARVHVLFSRREAAERNRASLSSAGIVAWYVDPETGMPKPA